jgi:hypothetical protein
MFFRSSLHTHTHTRITAHAHREVSDRDLWNATRETKSAGEVPGVEGIVGDGMAERLEVDPDLVRAAGLGDAPDQRRVARLVVAEPLEDGRGRLDLARSRLSFSSSFAAARGRRQLVSVIGRHLALSRRVAHHHQGIVDLQLAPTWCACACA